MNQSTETTHSMCVCVYSTVQYVQFIRKVNICISIEYVIDCIGYILFCVSELLPKREKSDPEQE